MEIIKNYGEKIGVFVVIAAYVDLILPDNSYRKYVKLIMGAMLTAIVLEPLSFIIKRLTI